MILWANKFGKFLLYPCLNTWGFEETMTIEKSQRISTVKKT